MRDKIRNIFLYSGVKKEEYDKVKTDILNANRMMIVLFSAVATILIAVMLVLSLFMESATQNQTVYIVGTICSGLLFLLAFILAKKIQWLTIPLIYVSYSIFYLYGIMIGTITNPTQQTVTFMVMLVFMPVLFNEPPFRFLICHVLYLVLFLVLCCLKKTGDILSIDISDACIYGALGAISGIIINHIKVRNYVLSYQLKLASRCDMLTQINNRNSFEQDLQKIPENCSKTLTCLYVDVNGLHELNNTQGHRMGDKMLQFIADQVKQFFGSRHSYRIGGDEFVTFAMDQSQEETEKKISEMIRVIEEEGYHIALGVECVDKTNVDMNELIRTTETKMYQSKAEFYSNVSQDRRKR